MKEFFVRKAFIDMQMYSQCQDWIALTIVVAVFCAIADVRGDDRQGGNDIGHPVEADLIKYDGLLIDSVEIENRNIFDTNVKGYDNFIFRTANKLHVKTQKKVLAREFLLKKGDGGIPSPGLQLMDMKGWWKVLSWLMEKIQPLEVIG